MSQKKTLFHSQTWVNAQTLYSENTLMSTPDNGANITSNISIHLLEAQCGFRH